MMHLRVTNFGTRVQLDTIWVDLKGQGHRSKVRVVRSKNMIFLAKKIESCRAMSVRDLDVVNLFHNTA